MIRSSNFTAARRRCVGILIAAAMFGCQANPPVNSELVQIGSMHETIGKLQHHGRVNVADIVRRQHFHGVGAVEGLEGEITVLDSEAVITRVTVDGALEPAIVADTKATLIVGQSVNRWVRHSFSDAVLPERFDDAIAALAGGGTPLPSSPFVFVVEGSFTKVRLHVINGACPIHARLKKQEIVQGQRPFELNAERLDGTLVGVYAVDAVGRLTHPATRTHAHLIYIDPVTGERVNGHVERVGVAKGAVLKLPG